PRARWRGGRALHALDAMRRLRASLRLLMPWSNLPTRDAPSVGGLSLRVLSNTHIFGLAGARLLSFCTAKRRRSRPSTESAFLLNVSPTKWHSQRQCHRSPLAPMEIGQENSHL